MAVVIKVEDLMNRECDSVRIWEVGGVGKDDIQSMGVYIRIQGRVCCGHRGGGTCEGGHWYCCFVATFGAQRAT